MLQKRLVPLPVAAFVLFLNFSPGKLTAGQRIPSPQALKHEMQLRALTPPGETTPDKAPVGPAAQFIATSTQRIDRDRARPFWFCNAGVRHFHGDGDRLAYSDSLGKTGGRV